MKEGKTHNYYIGLSKKLQGLGIILSLDNPITYNNYILFEVKILWFKFWYTYTLKKKV